MKQRKARRAFTLIELLVVIAIIAILSVVVILVLNPAELLRQSRDANRIADTATLNAAISLFSADLGGILGNASGTYISIPDPAATSTLGSQCQGLSLSALATGTGQFYQCSASSTKRSINGTGWLPINFSLLSSGSPIGSLPVDPTNASSSGLYYTFTTNGSQYIVTNLLESQKYKSAYSANSPIRGYPEVIAQGNNLTLSYLFNPQGLIGYWPLDEGSGSSTVDTSGNGNNGTWAGTAAGTNGTYYTVGKVGASAGIFNGTNNYIDLGTSSTLSFDRTNSFSGSFWFRMPTFQAASLFSKMKSANGYDLAYFPSNNSLNVFFSNTWNTNAFRAGATFPYSIADGGWHYLVTTYNGNSSYTGVQVYLDGVPMSMGGSENSLTGSILQPTASAVIGGRDDPSSLFQGSEDDVHIYNRVLSAAEVMAMYNAEK